MFLLIHILYNKWRKNDRIRIAQIFNPYEIINLAIWQFISQKEKQPESLLSPGSTQHHLWSILVKNRKPECNRISRSSYQFAGKTADRTHPLTSRRWNHQNTDFRKHQRTKKKLKFPKPKNKSKTYGEIENCKNSAWTLHSNSETWPNFKVF